MSNFQVFTKRMIPMGKAPFVTIQRRGSMSFNAAAHAAMGSPEAIEFLYDADERIVGVRGVDPDVEHAYPIRPMGTARNTFMVSGRAFTQHYGIDTEVARRYPAQMVDGVLCVDLKLPGTEVTGNRSRSNGNGAAPAPEEATPG